MNVVPIIKLAAKGVVSLGVGSVVGGAIKHVAAPNIVLHPAQIAVAKSAVWVGSLVLSAMLADQASEYTDKTIDEVIDTYKEAAEELKKQQNES
jgi:hypothetical protein